jgi:hypothetical protein
VDFLQRYLLAMQLDPASHLARALPVRALPAGMRAPPSDSWHPRVTMYEVGLQRVAMTIVSDAPGYAQLSHPWFQGSEVRINGRPVVPLEGAINLIVVPIAAGDNVIEINPFVSPIRRVSDAVSVVSLLLALVVAGALGSRRARSTAAVASDGSPVPPPGSHVPTQRTAPGRATKI